MSDSSSGGEELSLLPFDDGSTGRLIRRQCTTAPGISVSLM